MKGNIIYIIIFLIVAKLIVSYVESKMLYHPFRLNTDDNMNLTHHKNELKKIVNANISLNEYVIHDKKDNVHIHLIYYKNPNTTKYILYSHGNGGNIKEYMSDIYNHAQLGSIILYDYRSYGKSTGIANENGIYRDAYNAWRFIVHALQVHPSDIILFGHSLGCAVTAQLGQRLCNGIYKPYSIILRSGFSSLKDMVTDMFPKVASYVVSSKYDTMEYIKNISNKIPILVLHSHRDGMISAKHMYKLKKANPLITCHEIKGLHNSPIIDEDYIKIIKKFI